MTKKFDTFLSLETQYFGVVSGLMLDLQFMSPQMAFRWLHKLLKPMVLPMIR